MPYLEFTRKCQDADFRPIVLEQSRELDQINTSRFELHCMKVVSRVVEGDKEVDVYCTEELSFGYAYCPFHLTTGVVNNRKAVFEKIEQMVKNENVDTFTFGRNITIKIPRSLNTEYQFHYMDMVGVEENFQVECGELSKVVERCYKFFTKTNDLKKFNEHVFRFQLGTPAPFPSWKIFYAVLMEKVKLYGCEEDTDWRTILNRLVRLVATQGWNKVNQELFSPYGANHLLPNLKIKPHNENAVCYNVTAKTEGRLILEVSNGLQMTPKRKIDQQMLPLYTVETDLLEPVKDYAAVTYVGIASRSMYVDVRNTNKGLADSMLRNDPITNSGFNFAFLKMVNITDIHKPTEHSLAEDQFTAGGASLTEQEMIDIIENLNQKGRMRKGKRSKVADDRLVQSPRNVPFGSENNQSLKENWKNQDRMTQEQLKKARIAELEAPVIQAEMIKVTNELAKKRIKIIFFATGKQTVTRLAKDSFNFACGINPMLYQANGWYDFFQGKERLCDLVESPLVIMCPEVSSDGTAFEHTVRMKPEDIELWSDDQKVRYEAHVESQQVNCFHIQLAVITKSKFNPMRTYLKNWHGNPLLLSAISALENPTTLTREIYRYNTKYEKGPMTEVGKRINLKAIVCPNHRLKVMSQLINDNRGDRDTYTMIRNWFNTSDPIKDSKVPSFVTAHTFPPIPNDTTFKCSALAANAEDLVRASELINIEQVSEGSDEDKRLNSLIGKFKTVKKYFSQMTTNRNYQIQE